MGAWPAPRLAAAVPRSRARLRLLTLGLLVAGLFAVAARWVPHSPAALRAAVAAYGAVGPFVFVLLWAAVTPALVSGTLLAGASGLLFGPLVGELVGVAGATAGAALAFLLARRWGAGPAQALATPRAQRLQARVEARPFRALVALRLAPGVPTTVLNYAAGLTRIPARTFVAASAVGGAPRIFVYTALGGSLARPDSALGVIALAMFTAMTAAAGLLALRNRLRKRASLT